MINCLEPPDCCQGKVQSFEKTKEVKEVCLGSCWETGTLSKVKRPRWTSPRMLLKNASSSLCSTFFTGNFFVALEGRHWSNSSLGEVSEVNVKFVATWLKQRKKMTKYCSKCYSLLYIRYGMSEKRKTNHMRSCQSFSSFLKTDYRHLKTSFMDESACLWKQLKWNEFPLYGDRLSWKTNHGD